MLIRSLSLSGFRNLDGIRINPGDGVNVIYGENGQGKTNILEGIWLFTGSKSFRGAGEPEMIGYSRKFAVLKSEFESGGRENTAVIRIGESKSVKYNGVEQKIISKLSGKLYGVVFSPMQLSAVKGAPEERRRLIDAALCQVKAGYRKNLIEYQKLMLQRIASLRDLSFHPELAAVLDAWDESLAHLARRIMKVRWGYMKLLKPIVSEIFDGLSGGRDSIEIGYSASIECELKDEKGFDEIRSALGEARALDMKRGFTTRGPHRDDISIIINGKSARQFASQGQQRSAVLSIKLAQARLLREITNETPIVLLDDIMSELDYGRQDYILNHIGGHQVFITCCEMSQVMRMKAGAAFHVTNGALADGV